MALLTLLVTHFLTWMDVIPASVLLLEELYVLQIFVKEKMKCTHNGTSFISWDTFPGVDGCNSYPCTLIGEVNTLFVREQLKCTMALLAHLVIPFLSWMYLL